MNGRKEHNLEAILASLHRLPEDKAASERSEEFESSVCALRRLMSIIGMWPASPGRRWWFGSTVWCFHFCSFMSVYIIMLFSAMKVEHDLTSLLMDYILLCIQIQLNIVKCCVLNVKHESVMWLLHFMEKDWIDARAERLTCCDNKERALWIMSRYATFSRLFVFTFSGMFIGSWTFFVIEAMFKSIFPLRMCFPFDASQRSVYEIVLCCQSIIGYCMALSATTIDCLFVTIILHLCGQFEILASYVEGICDDTSNTVEVNRKIKLVIIRHQLLIRACEVAENSFNLIILGQSLACMINICLLGYGLLEAIAVNDLTSMMKFVLFLMGFLEEVFLFCFAGDYLTSQSSTITVAVCRIRWYGLPAYMGKSIILLLARSQKPIYITAKKFIPMSLNTFTQIVKTSVAYFSVLRTVTE